MSGQQFIGVMTGNSMDAADAILIHFDDAKLGNRCRIIAATRETIDDTLAQALQQLAHSATLCPKILLNAQNALTRVCAQAVKQLPVSPAAVTAIGCHGQTLAHQPAAGFSWQILNGALLAELTAIDVICDFRSRDIASGGEGAPLAPLFHQFFFARQAPCDIINIGGIANITHLDENSVSGYDTGPGMILLDAWYQHHQLGRFDQDGRFAGSGNVNTALLEHWLEHPFFQRSPPKSSGREEFSLAHILSDCQSLAVNDVQATLLELTARTITAAIKHDTVFIAGGGSNNQTLHQRLQTLLAKPIHLTSAVGLPVEQVEAAAFAWLAKCHINRQALTTAAITGGKPRIAGAHYPR